MPYVEKYVASLGGSTPGLAGYKSILASMPDWNPAEIIGPKPRPLAASIYRELVTRDIWRKAREHMGYRRMPPVELMVMLAGKPYIDVRSSFKSFLPRDLSANATGMLVDAWLDRLSAHPDYHDTIAFEIVHTCDDFTLADTFRERFGDLLRPADHSFYFSALKALTIEIVDSGPSVKPPMPRSLVLRRQSWVSW